MRGIENTRREMLAIEKACKLCGSTESLDVAPIVMPELLSHKAVKDALIVVCLNCLADVRPTAAGATGGKYSVDELFALNGTTYEDVKTKLGIEQGTDVIVAARDVHKKKKK